MVVNEARAKSHHWCMKLILRISQVPEKHLEIGLNLAGPLQYAIKPTDKRWREPRDLWNMSLPSFGAQFNYLHHDHVIQAEKWRSVFNVNTRFSHDISPGYPGEKSSVTFPQITHTWSESNLHKVPLQPPPPRNPSRRDLTMTPTEEPPGKTRGFGGSDCGESRWKKCGLCPGFITRARLGVPAESRFSTFFTLIFYSSF